jgi:phasin family protein
MPSAVRLREDYSAKELRALARRAKDVNQSRRLLSLAAVRDGMDRGGAAEIGGMDRQTLRDWVHRFNAAGPATTRLSTPHAPLGESSSLSPKPSHPSERATGRTSVSRYDPWYYAEFVRSSRSGRNNESYRLPESWTESFMTDATQSYLDILSKFGTELGLPTVDVDRLLEAHKKNIEALADSASVLSEGARSVAERNREIFEAGLREVAAMAREYRPLAAEADLAEKRVELAKKVFDEIAKNARDVNDIANQSTKEASRIFQDRLKASIDEIKASVGKSEKSRSA